MSHYCLLLNQLTGDTDALPPPLQIDPTAMAAQCMLIPDRLHECPCHLLNEMLTKSQVCQQS